MKIEQVICELKGILEREGNVEVTCTAALRPDDEGPLPEVFESTVENFEIRDGGKLGKRLRLYL